VLTVSHNIYQQHTVVSSVILAPISVIVCHICLCLVCRDTAGFA